MGLFEEASQELLQRLQTRRGDQRLMNEYCLLWDGKWPEVVASREQLQALTPTNCADPKSWPAKVGGAIGFSTRQTPEAVLQWFEYWQYPSMALLHRQIGFGLYALGIPGFPPDPPGPVDGTLYMRLVAEKQEFAVQVPLTAPWCEPRLIIAYARHIPQAHLGPLSKQLRDDFFRDFEAHIPGSQVRLWRVILEPTMPAVEVLTLLVILAQKQGFPVREDDWQRADGWMRRVMRQALQGPKALLVGDLAARVYQQLIRKFDHPGTPWGLRSYIKATSQGLAHAVLKAEGQQTGQLPEPELRVNPISGASEGWAYPLLWICRELDVPERTLRRWMDRHGYIQAPSGARALTEEGVQAFKKARLLRIARQYLISQGFSPEAAKKRMQRWKGQGLSEEEIVRRARDALPRSRGRKDADGR